MGRGLEPFVPEALGYRQVPPFTNFPCMKTASIFCPSLISPPPDPLEILAGNRFDILTMEPFITRLAWHSGWTSANLPPGAYR